MRAKVKLPRRAAITSSRRARASRSFLFARVHEFSSFALHGQERRAKEMKL